MYKLRQAFHILSTIPTVSTFLFFNSLHAMKKESYVDFLLIEFGLFSFHVNRIMQNPIIDIKIAKNKGAKIPKNVNKIAVIQLTTIEHIESYKAWSLKTLCKNLSCSFGCPGNTSELSYTIHDSKGVDSKVLPNPVNICAR